MIEFRVNIKFSFYIILSFMMFTVVGTLTHELGHIAVAKYLGYETELHYGSMNYNYKKYHEDEDVIKANTIFNELDSKTVEAEDLIKGEKFGELNRLRDLIDKKYPNDKKHSFYITLGGPIQTILTSFIGLYILWRRETKDRYSLQFIDWLGVFLSLFILREVFNFFTASYSSLFFNRSNFHGDEFRLSRYLDLNEWFIPSITLIIGLMISLFIIFRVIPIRYRFSFIISGLIGGVLGFLIWFGFLGSLLLP